MPLTLSFLAGEDFYVDKKRFVVEEVFLAKGCIVSNEEGEEFEVMPDKAVPILPTAKLSEGHRVIEGKTRIVYMAPRSVEVKRGDSFRHPEAVEQAELLGLSLDELMMMIELAAPVTDERGDWRYEKYILDIRDGKCFGIWEKDNPESPVIMRNRPCVFCEEQEGCDVCEHTGEVFCDISTYEDMKAEAAE